jgi:hypothetical protein
MVFPDLLEEQESRAFRVDGGMRWYEVRALGQTVDDTHNRVVPMGFRQLDYEVNADCVPWFRRCLRGLELTKGSSVLQPCPVTQIAGFDVDSDVAGHLGPPIVACYELQGLEAACISSNVHIMVLFNDTAPKVSVIRDIDLTVKHE